mmetsp:Transcript_28291/g.88166  ORF Transcript_28291/g.88166 Transcript_28291/m.88166 type:complete len:232 (-) Transcript_28291:528-1223(-)
MELQSHSLRRALAGHPILPSRQDYGRAAHAELRLQALEAAERAAAELLAGARQRLPVDLHGLEHEVAVPAELHRRLREQAGVAPHDVEEELGVRAELVGDPPYRLPAAHAHSSKHELAVAAQLSRGLLQPRPVRQDGRAPVHLAPAGGGTFELYRGLRAIRRKDPALLGSGGQAVENGGDAWQALRVGVGYAQLLPVLHELLVQLLLLFLRPVVPHTHQLAEGSRLLVPHQ